MGCPLKSSKDWKRMVEQTSQGDDKNMLAWATWVHYGEDYPPTLQSTTSLKDAMGIRNNVSMSQTTRMAMRVKQYNNRNKTSHSFDRTQVGQADIFQVEFKVNYLPYDVEARRQRDFQRSDEDKAYYDNTNPTNKGVLNSNTREISKEEEEIVSIHKNRGTYMQNPQGSATELTANNWIIAQTKGFKEFYGEYIIEPTNDEVLAYSSTEIIESPFIESEEVDVKDFLPEYVKIEKINHEATIVSNVQEAGKENLLAGDFLSMDESEFDMLFPDYSWIGSDAKQAMIKHIMRGNIKLNCGL